jgi:hypothetical protein
MTAEAVAPPATILTSVGVETRRDDEGSRWYVDPKSDEQFASVTTIIGMNTSKPWLVAWGAKLAAEYAVERHDLVDAMLAEPESERELSDVERAERARRRAVGAIDHVKREGARRRQEAAERGTWVHDVIEALVLDAPIPDVPPETQPFVDAFIDWHCEWNPTYLMAEATVCNRRHGYAGTADIVAYLPALDRTALIDAKSGANLDLEMPIQLTAYANAEEVWLPFGNTAPMPKVNMAAVLHLRPEGHKLIEVPLSGTHFSAFLRMLELTQWRDAQPRRMGKVIYPPLPDGSQPPPLLVDIDSPCLRILNEAGVTRLDHLADLTAEKLLALKGIGPAKLDQLRSLCAEHGVTLSGEEAAQ